MISITQVIILLLVGILLFGNIRKIIEQVVDSINYIKTKHNSKRDSSDESSNKLLDKSSDKSVDNSTQANSKKEEKSK